MGTPPATERLYSIDAYRGFVMLAMISAGLGAAQLAKADPSWGWLAYQCDHPPWEGYSAWDLIQPSFMFLVGVSMPFAFAARKARGDSWGWQFAHVLKRALLLCLIGIFLDSYGQGVVKVQFIRVLQQIAIGYVIAFLVMPLGPRVQAVTAALLLIGHTAAYLLFDPGNPWAPGHNFGAWLDRLMYRPFAEHGFPNILFPSSGNYATFNAVSSAATILFGVLTGEMLRRERSMRRQLTWLAVATVVGFAVGLALTPWVPMVKRIWTVSFTFYAAGWTCLFLFVFHGLTEGLRWRSWAFPFAVAGMNSIALYVASGTVKGTIRSALRPFITEPLEQLRKHVPWAEAVSIVLPPALLVLVLWLFCFWLYRRRIFFKV